MRQTQKFCRFFQKFRAANEHGTFDDAQLLEILVHKEAQLSMESSDVFKVQNEIFMTGGRSTNFNDAGFAEFILCASIAPPVVGSI